MRTRSDPPLRADVESVVQKLVDDFGELLQRQFRVSRAVERPRSPRPPSGDWRADAELLAGGEVSGAAERTAGGRLPDESLSEFWLSVLEFRDRFLRLHRPQQRMRLLRRLHESWAAFLRQERKPCCPPDLAGIADTFRDVYVLDGASTGEICSWGAEHGEDGADGRVLLLYDVLREFVAAIGVQGDEASGAPSYQAGIASAFSPVAQDALVTGGSLYASVSMFELLHHRKAHGVFRLGGESRLADAFSRGGEGLRDPNAPVEDGVIDVSAESVSIGRLRVISGNLDGEPVAAVTNVLNRAVLDAGTALRLAVPRWTVAELFAGGAGLEYLKRISHPGADGAAAQVYVAAIVNAAIGGGQRWLGDSRGQRSEGGDAESLFLQLTRRTVALVTAAVGDVARLEPRHESGSGPSFQERPGTAVASPSGLRPASRREMERIARIRLDPIFESFCRHYADVGHRDGFLWHWVHRGVELTTLPSVHTRLTVANRTAKCLGVMLDVLLDDVADNLKDGAFLEALIRIPFSRGLPTPPGGLSPSPGSSSPGSPSPLLREKREYFLFTWEVWREIERLARSFPRYDEFQEVFEFDYRQLLNTMRYAYLVNRFPELLNSTEHDLYQPHNMHMMISGTLDLMCSPAFELADLARVRQVLWRGQVMGRIGNMLTTWEREIGERDFTSGVFARAIERGVLSATGMARMPPRDVAAAIEGSGVLEYFLEEWENLRSEILELAAGVRSVDLTAYAAGLEKLIRNHLGSRGLK